MSVGGRKLSDTLRLGSDEWIEYPCISCAKDNKEVTAIKHCVECGENLCKTCLTYHDRFTRGHQIINNLSSQTEQKKKPELPVQRCNKHVGELNRLGHDAGGCSIRVAADHRKNWFGNLYFTRRRLESAQYLPSYWSKTSDPIRMINISSDARFIKLLVYNLWSPNDVGVGRDAFEVGTNIKFIKITKVQRVENVALFLKYDENREKLLRKEETGQCFKDLSQSPTLEVRTTQLIDTIPELASSPLGREIRHGINEHYLFHGTLSQKVESICRTGLSVARSMFGKSVCTAENPTKSDQYTDKGETVDKKILLCRVCLGEPYISKKYIKGILPPCRTCYVPDCKTHKLTFDSAISDVPGFRFREFIVYGDFNIYPEYIITYDRVEDDTEMRKDLNS